MKLKHLAVAAIAAGMLITTGCHTVPHNFSDASIPIDQGRYTVVGDEVMGEDTQVFICGIPLSLPGSGQRRALKQAIGQAPGSDALVSMCVDVQYLNLIFVQIVTTKISGTPVKTDNVR